MMIVYINDQLNRWAEWLRTGNTRLGYPTRSAFVAAMGGGGGQPMTMPDDQAMAINRAVAALEPTQRAVVECYYRSMRSCTVAEMGKHLGVTERTVFNRLDRAHNAIMGHLQDIEAGLPVPPYVAST
jgi:DNA-directed RNA polymerase specialized sigma24 family protein